MDSLTGRILVASQRLRDPNFARSVVLLVHHDARGALGVVLNRAGNRRVEATIAAPGDEERRVDLPVMIGGPMTGPLMVVHGDPDHAEREIIPGLFFAAAEDRLESLLAGVRPPVRIYSGYAGWAKGQLEAEIASGAWGVSDASPELVFGDETTLWQRVSRAVADAALARDLRIRHVPPEPWHN